MRPPPPAAEDRDAGGGGESAQLGQRPPGVAEGGLRELQLVLGAGELRPAALLDGDAARVGGFTGRFAGVVFPGETIRVQGWREDGRVVASATVAGGPRDGSPVLADCVLDLA